MSSLAQKVVNVKIISDVVWPFCFVGLRNLENASRDSGIKVRLEWEPFLLNPNIAPEGEEIREHLTKKYGAAGMKNFGNPDSHLFRAGREVGINFVVDRNVYPTVKAHALMEFVKEQDNDKANEIMEQLYTRYFENGENISSDDVLTEVITKVGVEDESGAVQAMNSPALQEQVRQKDLEYKTRMRVSGVPFFIIEQASGGRPIAFSGAQPADIIAEQLEVAAEE